MVVLDTDFIIDLMRGDPRAVARMEALLESPDPVGVCTITLMQLYHGVVRARVEDSEVARIDRALQGLTAFDLTKEIAMAAGRIDGRLARAGVTIDAADVIIGATALQRNEGVLTRNGRHFSRIPGLALTGY